jgi:chemotaxis protein methyltransferase CheR
MADLYRLTPAPITREEFGRFKVWVREIAGINLTEHKHALVMGRLACRLRHHKLSTYGDYFELLQKRGFPDEVQIAVDLLTTNETHFFREVRHFELFKERVIARHSGSKPLRVWSAACSSGEEPYSLAMTLAAEMGDKPWEVLASDISSRILERARSGHYAMARTKTIPQKYLQDYCLKGTGSYDGTFLVNEKIRNRVQFMQVNLNAGLPSVGEFDAIFLRNVMIYFDMATKREVVARLVRHLRPGGYFFIGHSESLNGVSEDVKSEVVSVYRKVA